MPHGLRSIRSSAEISRRMQHIQSLHHKLCMNPKRWNLPNNNSPPSRSGLDESDSVAGRETVHSIKTICISLTLPARSVPVWIFH